MHPLSVYLFVCVCMFVRKKLEFDEDLVVCFIDFCTSFLKTEADVFDSEAVLDFIMNEDR